jgi:hypothetical protein
MHAAQLSSSAADKAYGVTAGTGMLTQRPYMKQIVVCMHEALLLRTVQQCSRSRLIWLGCKVLSDWPLAG